MKTLYGNTHQLSLCNFRVQRLEKEEQKILCISSSKQRCGKEHSCLRISCYPDQCPMLHMELKGQKLLEQLVVQAGVGGAWHSHKGEE